MKRYTPRQIISRLLATTVLIGLCFIFYFPESQEAPLSNAGTSDFPINYTGHSDDPLPEGAIKKYGSRRNSVPSHSIYAWTQDGSGIYDLSFNHQLVINRKYELELMKGDKVSLKNLTAASKDQLGNRPDTERYSYFYNIAPPQMLTIFDIAKKMKQKVNPEKPNFSLDMPDQLYFEDGLVYFPDDDLHIWEEATGKLLHRIDIEANPKEAFKAAKSQRIKAWLLLIKRSSGRYASPYSFFEYIRQSRYDSTILVSMAEHDILYRYDKENKQLVHLTKINRSIEEISCFCPIGEDHWLIYSNDKHEFTIWRLSDMQLVDKWQEPSIDSYISDMKLSPDGNTLMMNKENSILFYNLKKKAMDHTDGSTLLARE